MHIQQVLDLNQYGLMRKEIQDMERITQSMKKFFEEIFQRNGIFCQQMLQLSQSKQFDQNDIFESNMAYLNEVLIHQLQTLQLLFTKMKVDKDQLTNIQRFYSEVNQDFELFNKHQEEYIIQAIKVNLNFQFQLYRQSEQQLKEIQNELQDRKKSYKESLFQYEQTQNDPSMIYNNNLKIQKFQIVQTKYKKIKECEQKFKSQLELINSRRKTLCIDLKELRKLSEDLLTSIIFNCYQTGKKNVNILITGCNGFNIQKRKKFQRYSILPDPSKFNFNKNNTMDLQFLVYEQRKLNFQDDIYDLNSFRSLNRSIARSDISEDYTVGLPQFLQQDIQGLPQSLLIQYQEWIKEYLRSVKDNCTKRNEQIIALQQYIDNLIQILKKQGRPCIPVDDIRQKPILQLKWFNEYSQIYGDLGVRVLDQQIQLYNLFNLYAMQLSIYLKSKQDTLIQLKQWMIKQQNIAFSSIDKQIEDLSKVQTAYLKQQGLVIKNRTVALSTMDQTQNSTQKENQNQDIEREFRISIQTTCRVCSHLIEQLDQNEMKTYRTLNELIESISHQVVLSLKDVQNFQQIPNVSEFSLKKQIRVNAQTYLKTRKAFQIFYQVIDNSQLLDKLMEEEFDQQFQEPEEHDNYRRIQRPSLESVEDHKSNDESEVTPQLDNYRDEEINFLKERIKLENNEFSICSYACALSEKIQLQGRLYFTNKRLFFHSSFNSSNIFFGDTTLNIPKSDILYIQKRTNAYIFDNSISIHTPKGQIFFATFFARDDAYNMMIKVFAPKEQPELMAVPSDLGMLAIKFSPINFNQEQLQYLKEREQRLLKLIPPNPPVLIAEHTFTHPELTLRLFYKLLFSDRSPNQTLCFYEKMKLNAVKCTDINLTKWVPDPPIEFDPDQNGESILTTVDHHERYFKCTQPLPSSSIPFMPKVCGSDENQKLYFLSLDKIILDMIVKTYKAPYCESFHVFVRYEFEKVPEGIKFTCRIENVFYKSIMVQKIIDASSREEISKTTKNSMIPLMEKEINNYFDQIAGKQIEEEQQIKTIEPQNTSLIKKMTNISLNIVKWTIILAVLYYTISFCYHHLSRMRIQIDYV